MKQCMLEIYNDWPKFTQEAASWLNDGFNSDPPNTTPMFTLASQMVSNFSLGKRSTNWVSQPNRSQSKSENKMLGVALRMSSAIMEN